MRTVRTLATLAACWIAAACGAATPTQPYDGPALRDALPAAGDTLDDGGEPPAEEDTVAILLGDGAERLGGAGMLGGGG
jgi:hypothetical protein